MRALPVILLVCLGPALSSLGDEVMEVDPAQYADVAARVVQRGDWLHLEDLNGPFINKPPLMPWAQAAAMTVLGPTSLAARLPALGFGLLVVLGTFLVGRALADRRVGAVASVLVAGSVALHHGVADPKVDLALTAMTTLAVWAFVSRRIAAGWLFAGLAVLAKGPVGLGIVALAVLPEALRSLPAPPGERARDRGRHLLGVALFLALTTPFYLSLTSGQAGYLLWTQGFGRLFGTSDFRDSTTPLYFVHTGAWALLPMTPLLVAALGRGARRLWRERSLPADLGRVPAWWFLLVFAVISASHYKLPQYVYWLAPPAALLGAQELFRCTDVGLARWRLGFGALALLAAALGVAVLLVAFPPSVGGWAGLVVGLALPGVAWVLCRRPGGRLDEGPRRLAAWERTAAIAATSCAGFLALYHAWIHPSLLEYQPWREVGEAAQVLPADAPLLLIDVAPTNALSFYARRRLQPAAVDEVKAARPALFVASDAALDALRAAGVAGESVVRLPLYPVSLPRGPFLRATTRETQLQHVHVVRAPR